MKVSIEGFNQEYAINLRAEKIVKDKKKLIKVDCTDLVILRWFVDFYPNTKKVVVDGKEYAWISHKKIVEDLPIVDISKRAFSERLQKLVDFKILTYKLIKENGTFTVYGFGENYINLVKDSTSNNKGSSSNDIGVVVQTTTGSGSNDIGVAGQTATKDKTINNKTIINKTIIDKNNIGSKAADEISSYEFNILKNEFEDLWSKYPKKRGKKEAFEIYCKYRKATNEDYITKDDVEDGIEQYNRYIKAYAIENKYIKYGSTFFEERAWEDDYEIDNQKAVFVDWLERHQYGKLA